MYNTYDGTTDLSLIANILGIPADFEFPKELTTVAKAYNDAFADYDASLIEAEEARRNLETAGDRDKAALTEAFDAGNSDPGTNHHETAERAARIADERVRHTAARLNRAGEAVTDAITTHRDAVLKAAVVHDRGQLARITHKWQQITALIDEANAMTRTIGTHSNFVLQITNDHRRVEASPADVILPPLWIRNNDSAAATLEAINPE